MTPDLPPIHPCEWAVCQAGTDAAIAHQHAQINLFLSRLTEPQRRWYAGMLSQAPTVLVIARWLSLPASIQRPSPAGAPNWRPGCPPLCHPASGGRAAVASPLKKRSALSTVLQDLV